MPVLPPCSPWDDGGSLHVLVLLHPLLTHLLASFLPPTILSPHSCQQVPPEASLTGSHSPSGRQSLLSPSGPPHCSVAYMLGSPQPAGPLCGAPAPLPPHPVSALASPPPAGLTPGGSTVCRPTRWQRFATCSFFSGMCFSFFPDLRWLVAQGCVFSLRDSSSGTAAWAPCSMPSLGQISVFLLSFSSVCDGTFIRGAGQPVGFAHCFVLTLAPEPRSLSSLTPFLCWSLGWARLLSAPGCVGLGFCWWSRGGRPPSCGLTSVSFGAQL